MKNTFIVSCLLSSILGFSLPSALACPGASVEIPLATDSCNSLSGQKYADCLTDRSHSVQFGQLSSLRASGRGLTIEGRTFTYHPVKKTWCEETSAGCLQVYPDPKESDRYSVLVGFCLANNRYESCQTKGLPAKGSARKDPKNEVGYIAFDPTGASIRPTNDKDGYEYSPQQRFMLIYATPIEMDHMLGLRFEAKIYDPRLRSLDQVYELASNMDTFGNISRGLPRVDQNTSAGTRPLPFGKEDKFQFSAGCSPLKKER